MRRKLELWAVRAGFSLDQLVAILLSLAALGLLVALPVWWQRLIAAGCFIAIGNLWGRERP